MKRNVYIDYSYNYLKIFKDIKKNETTTLDLHPRITDKIERINL